MGSRKKGVKNSRARPLTGHGICQGDQGVSKLQARVKTIESQLAHIIQLLLGMSGSLGVFQGASPRDNAPRPRIEPLATVWLSGITAP